MHEHRLRFVTRGVASGAPEGTESACLLSRREFLSGMAATAAASSVLGAGAVARSAPKPRFKIIGFTKPFQTAGPSELADIVARIGWDGIECPVRPKGQVEPERVEDELPRVVEALRSVGREVTILTTAITKLNPLAERVLRTASRLGIKRYRLGFWTYTKDKSIPDQIAEVHAAMRDLVALNKELGITGAHQNHSGAAFFGAPVWDIHAVIKDYDPRHLGICFDIGHATIEGLLSWPIQARLMQPYFAAVYLKDFLWQRGPAGWRLDWCPLGKGTVDPKFFQMLKQSDYAGPISQHHEYEVGSGVAMIQAMKRDLEVLKRWLET